MPCDVRHRDVLDAVDLAEVVDADDVLVRDLAREQQFALEAPLELRAPSPDPAVTSGRITLIATATPSSCPRPDRPRPCRRRRARG